MAPPPLPAQLIGVGIVISLGSPAAMGKHKLTVTVSADGLLKGGEKRGGGKKKALTFSFRREWNNSDVTSCVRNAN